MLLEFFQKHRRAILVLVIIFVGLPMGILFGIPNPFVGNDMPRFDQVVIEVRGVPVDAQQFLASYSNMSDRLRSQSGETPTAEELIANGTVNDLIRNLADDAYLTSLTVDKPYRPTQEYLEKRLREYPDFRNENGEFDPKLYNRWVTFRMESGGDWTSIWNSVAEQVKRDVFVELTTASARVFESDIRERFETLNTKVKVRFAAIEPPLEADEETLRAYHSENILRFQTPEKRNATIVRIEIPEADLDDPENIHAAASELAEAARGDQDLSERAAALGYEVITAIGVNSATTELPGIDTGDVGSLRQALGEIGPGGVTDPLRLGDAIYVAQVTEVVAPHDSVFEDVREDVEEDWKRSQKQTEAYHDRVHEYIDAIVEAGISLTEAAEQHPELNLEPEETPLFGAGDMLFDQGWLIDPSLVIQTARDLEVGAVGGPVKDFQGIEFLIEVLEKEGPTEEMWNTEWPEQRDMALEAMRNQLAVEQLDDYLLHGMERATENQEVYIFQEAIERVLGVEQGGADAPTEDAASEAPVQPDAVTF